MKPVNKPFRYFTEKESRSPGYLARRFQQIRREQAEAKKAEEAAAEEAKRKVRKIGGKA